MGLIFHSGHNPAFCKYVNNRNWDHEDFIGDAGNFATYNNPDGIRGILTHHRSETSGDPRQPGGGEENFKGVILADGVNIYVLKGIHQSGDGIMPTPHITIGYNGYLYHLKLAYFANTGLIVTGVSKGHKKAQDADGYTEQKTKKRGR
jgi:hypothetical protein